MVHDIDAYPTELSKKMAKDGRHHLQDLLMATLSLDSPLIIYRSYLCR